MTPYYGPPQQYYGPPPEQPKPYAALSVVTILGVAIFILPWFGPIIGWNIPKWIMGFGVLLIIIGAGLSIGKIIMGDE